MIATISRNRIIYLFVFTAGQTVALTTFLIFDMNTSLRRRAFTNNLICFLMLTNPALFVYAVGKAVSSATIPLLYHYIQFFEFFFLVLPLILVQVYAFKLLVELHFDFRIFFILSFWVRLTWRFLFL